MSRYLLCKSCIRSIASSQLSIPGRLMLALGCVLMNRPERGGLCPVQPQSSPGARSWSAGVGVGPAGALERVDGQEWLQGSWSPGLHAWLCVGTLSQNTTARKRMGWHAFSDRCSTRGAQPGVWWQSRGWVPQDYLPWVVLHAMSMPKCSLVFNSKMPFFLLYRED